MRRAAKTIINLKTPIMKNSFYAVCFVIFSAILFTSCSKSTEDLVAPEPVASSVSSGTISNSNFNFVNHLYGFRVVPTNSSLGHGVLRLSYSSEARAATYSLTFERVIPVEAHIHTGLPNENGPIAFDLGKSSGTPFEGRITLTESQVADLLSGRMYVDVHTEMFKDGEIRAQIGRE